MGQNKKSCLEGKVGTHLALFISADYVPVTTGKVRLMVLRLERFK
jgi:hypothetical protein